LANVGKESIGARGGGGGGGASAEIRTKVNVCERFFSLPLTLLLLLLLRPLLSDPYGANSDCFPQPPSDFATLSALARISELA